MDLKRWAGGPQNSPEIKQKCSVRHLRDVSDFFIFVKMN